MTTPMTLEKVRELLRPFGQPDPDYVTLHRLGLDKCEAAIDAAIREREEQAKVIARLKNPWMPIETAPKDGTWVLAFSPDGETLGVAQWTGTQWRDSGNSEDVEWEWNVTHWMPLPPPPNEGEKE